MRTNQRTAISALLALAASGKTPSSITVSGTTHDGGAYNGEWALDGEYFFRPKYTKDGTSITWDFDWYLGSLW